jgi:hypothetical protein
MYMSILLTPKSRTGYNFFRKSALIFIFLSPILVKGQGDSLLNQLNNIKATGTEYIKGAFKSTRVINAQSLENLSEGVLDFRIMHRFGAINNGITDLFGLDLANTRIQFDYGVKDWLQVGFGRSGAPKSYSGYVKWKFLRQSEGDINMPISVLYHGYMSADALTYSDPVREKDFSSRLSYVHQLIIGRKFNENFSLELIPTFIHKNLVEHHGDPNDYYAMGFGLRQKISKHASINFEYFYLYPTFTVRDAFKNSLSIGVDIETGGHVFQLHLTNTLAMNENDFITDRNESWLERGIHLGFNISRVFTIYKPAVR